MEECRKHTYTQTNLMGSADGGSQHEYFKKGVVQGGFPDLEVPGLARKEEAHRGR